MIRAHKSKPYRGDPISFLRLDYRRRYLGGREPKLCRELVHRQKGRCPWCEHTLFADGPNARVTVVTHLIIPQEFATRSGWDLENGPQAHAAHCNGKNNLVAAHRGCVIRRNISLLSKEKA
jgi:hypothetical protein